MHGERRQGRCREAHLLLLTETDAGEQARRVDSGHRSGNSVDQEAVAAKAIHIETTGRKTTNL